jgi:hypothetical protein
MKDIIGGIAVILGLVAYLPYFRDILKGRVRPHPYSWLVWGLTSIVVFALQALHGAGAGAWTTATVAVISIIVCGLALRYGGRKTITAHDNLMLGISLIAILLWLPVKQPTISMLLLVGADIFGLIPSIRKTWHDPYSETLPMWWINGLRHLLSIFALSQLTVLTLANPLVWAISNLGFCLFVLVRRHFIRAAAIVIPQVVPVTAKEN